MYHVVSWDTNEVMTRPDGTPLSFEKLAVARRWCRGQGHTGEDNSGLTGYPPIARVQDDDGYCVYNPRFSKNISAAVGNVVNSNDDCLRG